jgi:hypothetical protein
MYEIEKTRRKITKEYKENATDENRTKVEQV